MKYRIHTDYDLKALEEKVEDSVDDGWTLWGGLAMVADTTDPFGINLGTHVILYGQAMVKDS